MANKKKEKRVTITILEKNATELISQIKATRKAIAENESALRRTLSQKQRLDDELNSLLKRRFSSEKSQLSKIKRSAEKREEGLGERISSLERITKIYEAKKNALLGVKRRHAALERQLEKMEKELWV